MFVHVSVGIMSHNTACHHGKVLVQFGASLQSSLWVGRNCPISLLKAFASIFFSTSTSSTLVQGLLIFLDYVFLVGLSASCLRLPIPFSKLLSEGDFSKLASSLSLALSGFLDQMEFPGPGLQGPSGPLALHILFLVTSTSVIPFTSNLDLQIILEHIVSALKLCNLLCLLPLLPRILHFFFGFFPVFLFSSYLRLNEFFLRNAPQMYCSIHYKLH